jgi:hypothetical protein
MRLTFAIIPLLFTSALYGQAGSYDPAKLYPVDSLKADLHYLRHKLEVMHPGLYRYATPVEMAELFDSLSRVIRRPMNEQHFLSLLMLVQARIRNGHTMFLPGADAMSWLYTRERFLPFDVRSFGGRLFIRQNYSADGIERGAEITSINGVGAAKVWRQETGGNATIISGDPDEVILPYTKINCSISTKIYHIREGANTGHGVIPQYPLRPELGDLITGRDRAMEMAERLVNRW